MKEDTYKFLNKNLKITDLITVYLLFLVGAGLSLLFKVNYITNIFLFTVPPILFLLSKQRRHIWKHIITALLLSIPASWFFDTLGHMNNAWFESSLLNTRLWGQMPYEGFLWGFMFLLIIISFYDHFFDKYSTTKFTKRSKLFLTLIYICLLIFALLFKYNQDIFRIPFYYLFVLILSFVVILITHRLIPHLLKKTFLTSIYLFPVFMIWEITALELNLWGFERGEHIGYLELFSRYEIPLEEILWFVIVVMACATIHEVFMDNKR